jgi:hypothetical protein
MEKDNVANVAYTLTISVVAKLIPSVATNVSLPFMGTR